MLGIYEVVVRFRLSVQLDKCAFHQVFLSSYGPGIGVVRSRRKVLFFDVLLWFVFRYCVC